MASSVKSIDCKIRSGTVTAIAPKFPAILHGDVAGVIESVAKMLYLLSQAMKSMPAPVVSVIVKVP